MARPSHRKTKGAVPTLAAYFVLLAGFGITSEGSRVTFEDFGESRLCQGGSDEGDHQAGQALAWPRY